MTYYFIGIKGTGMASLARILKDLGEDVLGSDIQKETFTQLDLQKNHIKILPFDSSNIEDDYIVIRGNAFDADHIEVAKAISNGNKIFTYPQAVQMLIERFISIGVAGAHGKTTTTSLLSYALSQLDQVSYLIGDGVGKGKKDDKYFVFEADEYRRHFSEYKPSFGIVTNIDFDHPDYFRDIDDVFEAFQEFAIHVKDTLFVFGDDKYASRLKASKIVKFGFEKNNDYIANVISQDEYGTLFEITLLSGQKLGSIKTNITGIHGVIDTLAITSLLHYLGFDIKQIQNAINNFPGAKRRFNIHHENNFTFIDDYAHHPNEIKTTIQAARQNFPKKEIVAVFQPHTFSRVEAFFDDYVKVLNTADQVILTPIFGSARESNGKISSEDLGIKLNNFEIG
ncbi:MAG: UDP-N-acetylmuramate--L-alanine ligase, partial [Lactobacillaceae bacterium]|nr:UDP-N-acetylmuramate--L-alanine ligase [Lactobacillaceae bacterium]